ncbi:diguanylate cyclase [Hahella aquimaris]|uniref:diguanylate cyclase domain-containing protein n=1 Tax=Hahella sp. HNIBRBA332 TaxID=3015983 RepID=UPI00273BC0FF|nr:diguanylate cyclase [Hahella sp. HNIBRBA332]WLQ16673.1 diguanylate cyclase [Hahella sp. HNIBRBA332]
MHPTNLWELPLPHLLAETDHEGAWIECNDLWREYSGLSASDSLGMRWIEVIHQDDISTVQRGWRSGIAAEVPFELKMRLQRSSDSSYRWHVCHVVPLNNEQGDIPNWLASFTDIQGDKAQQENGHSSVAKLQSEREMLATSNDYLLEVLREYRETEIRLEKTTEKLNQIVETQSHLSQAEIDMTAFMQLVTEKMLTVTPATGAVIELMEGDEMVYQAASGSVHQFEGLRLNLYDSLSGLCVTDRKALISEDTANDPRVNHEACKKVGAASIVVTPLYEEGNIIGVLKILSDTPHAFDHDDLKTLEMMAGLIGSAIGRKIRLQEKEDLLMAKSLTLMQMKQEEAQRKNIEAQLKASEMRIRRIIESSHEAFIAMNACGVITDWNPKAEETFGWTATEAIGSKLSDLIIPTGLRERHEIGMRKFIATGQGIVLGKRLELLALNNKGEKIPVEITISAISAQEQWQFCAFLHDISERKQIEQKLRHLAQYDSLTSLPNRALFYDRLNQAFARSHRNNALFALMYLDIDHFKAINDTHGHGIGDKLLSAFSHRIQLIIRESDTLARLGGDEFIIIAESIGDQSDAEHIAQKILWAMKKEFQLNEVNIQVGTSIGVALLPTHAITADGLVKMADKALYSAKKAGRNTYRVYEETSPATGKPDR